MEIFVTQKVMSTHMIGLYVHKSFSLHIGFLKTVQINNQTILHFFMVQKSPHPYQLSKNC